ncbi:MAG: phosphoadenosine phosphosulfate reductase family protein, partial [Oscillospiraceae bacterium]
TKNELKYEAQKEVLEYLEKNMLLGSVLTKDGKLKSMGALERACTPTMMEDFSKRNLIWKAGTTKSYFWCMDQYGYPILGKAASKLTARRINIDCFLKYSETKSEKDELKEYYELLKNVKMSNHCCSILKKEPSEELQAKLDVDVIFKGLMASESQMRRLSFSTRGYLFESSRPHCDPDPFYHCNPLAIWTDDDIWEYIRKYDVPYSKLYDLEYKNYRGEACKIKRNGCIWCATDIAFKDNHLSVLRQTHPKLWAAGMKSGLGDEIMKLQRFKSNGIPNLINVLESAADTVNERPCAFDDVGGHIAHDEITDSFYDAESEEE